MRIVLSLIALLSGCSLKLEPTPEVDKALQQHTIILDAVVKYIQDCQAKGICPKPEPEKK
jgi:outer membrane biogenesis lipoprotein LolB